MSFFLRIYAKFRYFLARHAKREETIARHLFAAAHSGHASAAETLAELYFFGDGCTESPETAREWWQIAADAGHPAAQNNLGVCFETGRCGSPIRYAEAFKWYKKAAEQGDPTAQFNLGVMYVHGHGVDRDYAEALKWFKKAADQGETEAQNAVELLQKLLDEQE